MSDDDREYDDDNHSDREDEDDDDYEGDEEDEEEEEEDKRSSKRRKSGSSSSKGKSKSNSKKSKKSKKKSSSSFFEEEAEEGDESEDEEEAERGYREYLLERQNEQNRPKPNKFRELDLVKGNKTEEELSRELEKRAERYDEEDDYEVDEEDDIDDTGLPNQSYWRVKCRPGEEKQLVASMMQKFYNQQNTPDKVMIKSVLAPQHLPGHVYIEAEREMHVKQAIRGMHQIIHTGMIMVPLKDMIEILSTNRIALDLPRGTWIRIKLGKYKEDIGQVMDYDSEKGKCTVKLIPRLDLNVSTKNDDPNNKRKKLRPPQRFFNAKDLAQMGEVTRRTIMGETYSIYNNERYRNGFLFKQMGVKSIISDGVVPSLEELQKFQDRKDSEYDDDEDEDSNLDKNMNNISIDAQAIPKMMQKAVSFGKGDTVKVIDGDLRGLMGKVESVDDKSITVLPVGLHELLIFNPSDLQKYFSVGNHVKVLAGRYEGDTGLILRLEDNTAIILGDLTNTELKVRIQDLQECTEIATGKLELGSYELHDLVQITPQKVGIIIKVERDSFKILDETSNVTTVKLQEVLNKKRTRNATTMDSHSNTLSANDAVEILDGQYRGKQGVILHISRNFLFLKSRDVFENDGIFVVRANYSSLLGGSKNRNNNMNNGGGFGSNSNGSGGRGGFSGGRGGGGGGRGGHGGGRGREDSPVNKKVVIKSGTWKGYMGIVKECTDTMVQVQLETNLRKVMVNRNDIAMPGLRNDDSQLQQQQLYMASRTPSYRDENPSMTPMRMNTPSRSAANDLWSSNSSSSRGNNSWFGSSSGSNNYARDESTPNDYYGTTPGTSYSAYTPFTPSTPSGESHSGSRQSNDGYTPINIPTPSYDTPTPSSYHMTQYDTPGTHNMDQIPPSPYTPHAPQTPATPSTPSTDDGDNDEFENQPWQATGFEVVFKSGTQHASKLAVVTSNYDRLCTVKLVDTQQQVHNVHQDDLELVTPAKKDIVVVIRGPHATQSGSLFVITTSSTSSSSSGVVKLTATDFKVHKMHNLGRLHEQ